MNNPKEHPTSKEDFQALMDFMTNHIRITDAGFEDSLFPLMKTRVYDRPKVIQKENRFADKIFFIPKGMVFAFFFDSDQEIVAFRLFKAGELALIPESFMNNRPAEYSLIACSDTRLLEITLSQVRFMFDEFPQAVMLSLQVISNMFHNDMVKNKILSLGHEASILKFYEIFPDLFGNTTYCFRDKYISRYLNITPVTFSRLRKKLFPNYPEY